MDTQVEFIYADARQEHAEMSYRLWKARLQVNPLRSVNRPEPDLKMIIAALERDDQRSKIKETAK